MLSVLSQINHGVGSGATDFGGYDSYVKKNCKVTYYGDAYILATLVLTGEIPQ